jgi:hypothetical protein
MDSFAIDVSFLNVQVDNHNDYSASSSASSGSLLKLEGLYFSATQSECIALLRRRHRLWTYLAGGVSGQRSAGRADGRLRDSAHNHAAAVRASRCQSAVL